MSVGTVLVMSGDAIYMDYFSCLGPINPQIQRDGRVVPALSYLLQYQRLVEKSTTGEGLTAAELSKSLIQEWLSTYKSKDWAKGGAPVDDTTKQNRAKEVADMLNNHQKWYTHGHGIHKDVLERDLKLKIDDYSDNPMFRGMIWQYFWPLREYCMQNQSYSLVHTRGFL